METVNERIYDFSENYVKYSYIQKNIPLKSERNEYLVHAGVGKQQSGVIHGHHSRRVDILVLMATEEVDELLTDLSCTQQRVHSRPTSCT